MKAFPDELFYLIELLHLINTAEGDCPAGSAGPACAADPVDIGFRLHRHVIVKHVAESGHIDTPGSDVRCHQYPAVTGAEAVQGCLAGVLAFVTVDTGRLNTLALQIPDNAIHPVFRTGKNQSAFHIGILQQMRKQKDYEMMDRITIFIEADEEVKAAVEEHRDYIMEETLAEAGCDPKELFSEYVQVPVYGTDVFTMMSSGRWKDGILNSVPGFAVLKRPASSFISRCDPSG